MWTSLSCTRRRAPAGSATVVPIRCSKCARQRILRCDARIQHSTPDPSEPRWLLLTAIASGLQLPEAAWADGANAAYDAGSQGDFLRNLAGVGYVFLVIYFLYRVLTRRAKRFKEEKLTSGGRANAAQKSSAEEDDPELREPIKVSPLNAAASAVQACAIAAVLYWLSTSIDAAMASKPMPDSYTARQISVTVRTIISGLAYLATFIFAANGLGLTALTMKLAIFGDDEPVPVKARKPKDLLPKVALTSDPEDVMKAFDQVSDPSNYRKRNGTDATG